ncbi:dtw domain-containing protein 2 [Phtheirospermum japonicum]|uniref:tRNA-uridine aminocarboxypropyltransferase n=1 Tax=Phtheirospermum japonicum TaxID=374723 RepID=A0A830CVM7_9LAMI|nr:dtw domain-containing protein 2 [Phtheirospermum japonicum]
MPVTLRARIGLQLGPIPQFHLFLNPSTNKIIKSPRIQTLNCRMVTQAGSTKRPTCPSCSKPARICLCSRLRAPKLDNSVAVTVLQHSLEKNHPLNSTRIATLGFKNVDVITVSDVNFQARFFMRLLDARCSVDRAESDETHHVFDEMPSREINDFSTAISLTIGKYGDISSFIDCTTARDKSQEIMSFDELFASDIAFDVIKKGFVVKKAHTKPSEGNNENKEIEEFEITIRPGSVLLFPSEGSVDVGDLNIEVKNLIVLDGTWAKAKRMYYENPWLRLLPHVKLDLDISSLYSEVRHQPKAGYLSTIESIVYAMKAVGKEDDYEGLGSLLDVFESMVGDQRRCKDERLSKASQE